MFAFISVTESHAGWNINKFKVHMDKGCIIDKEGNYAYWFCGKPNTQWCCDGLCRAAGQYKYELKQSEVLTLEKLKAGESDISDESLDGKYICCHKNYSTSNVGETVSTYDPTYYSVGTSIGTNQGVLRLASDVVEKTEQNNGKTCTQKYDACGNKVGACEALCGDSDKIEINGKCEEKCASGYAYESENSFVCIKCPTGPRQKIVKKSDGGYNYCLQCDSSEFIKGDTCAAKSEFDKYTSQEMIKCWKCASSDSTLTGCLTAANKNTYIKEEETNLLEKIVGYFIEKNIFQLMQNLLYLMYMVNTMLR